MLTYQQSKRLAGPWFMKIKAKGAKSKLMQVVRHFRTLFVLVRGVKRNYYCNYCHYRTLRI